MNTISASAALVNWQLAAPSLNVASEPASTALVRPARFESATGNDSGLQIQFKNAAQSNATGETREIMAAALSDKLQARDTDFQQASPSTITSVQSQSAMQPVSALDQRFAAIPNFQFPSAAFALTSAPVASRSGGEPVPVPEMSALFPVLGLLVAVSCTRILRRRRAAQISTSRNFV